MVSMALFWTLICAASSEKDDQFEAKHSFQNERNERNEKMKVQKAKLEKLLQPEICIIFAKVIFVCLP